MLLARSITSVSKLTGSNNGGASGFNGAEFTDSGIELVDFDAMKKPPTTEYDSMVKGLKNLGP